MTTVMTLRDVSAPLADVALVAGADLGGVAYNQEDSDSCGAGDRGVAGRTFVLGPGDRSEDQLLLILRDIMRFCCAFEQRR
jgi:hypothetical protein